MRFQFRRDAEGAIQIYGIHTGKAGNVSVPTVQVQWNDKKTALEAELNGITILWTPRTDPWDSQHGAVEVYDKQGNHLGEFDATTGEQTGRARPERQIITN